MIALKLDQVLISSVSFVQGFTVMWLNEVILLTSGEKCRNKGLGDVRNRCQFIQIEASLFLYGLLDERHGSANEEFRNFRM